MEKDLERLIRYIRKEDVALFVGSGFSIKAGAPNVWQIIEAILKDGGQAITDSLTESDCGQLRVVSEAYVKECCGRNELIMLLKRLFDFMPQDCSDQLTLTKIPHIKQIFTTNYDTLIEDAYPKSKRSVVTSNEGCAYTDEGLATIYKVHGDITTLNDSSSIIITDSDYKGFFKNKRFNLIWEELKRTFIKKHVVFIGYSLEDDNILEIIKAVRNSIGKSMKGMFLVSPKMSDAKINQLEKNNVTYIKATAEDVLGKVLNELKDNIVDDYRHQKVSKETYDAFLELNADIYTTTTHLQDKNVIDNIEAKKGKPLESKINFTVPTQLKNAIEGECYNSNVVLNGTHIKIPALKIPTDKMSNFSHSINGICFANKDNISSFILSPSVEEMKVTLKMPSIGFKETKVGYRHQEKSAVIIDIETPICILSISIDRNLTKMNFNIQSNDTYTNSQDAIKWIDFIIGSFSGEEFFVNGIKLKSDVTKKIDIEDFRKAKVFYETIQRIEMEMDVDFDVYENYSSSNLFNALCVYHYFAKKGFLKELPKNAAVTFEVDSRDPQNVPVDKFSKDAFVMVKCEPLGKVELNKKSFYIPFCTTVFMDCKAEKVIKIDEYKYSVTMRDESPKCTIWCTDTEPKQEGNVLNLGCKKIS